VKETDILRAICDYLAHKRLFFWRQNTAPAFDWKTKTFRRMPAHAMRGVPDIIVVKDGKFIGIEVKQPKGRQSPEQTAFQQQCEAAGGQYFIARSLDDVLVRGI
jgi:hypothetical protein